MILGELCNFAAYAFTEAIIVVRDSLLTIRILSQLLLDSDGCFIGCNIGSLVAFLAQRKAFPLWVDRLPPMSHRLFHTCSEWT